MIPYRSQPEGKHCPAKKWRKNYIFTQSPKSSGRSDVSKSRKKLTDTVAVNHSLLHSHKCSRAGPTLISSFFGGSTTFIIVDVDLLNHQLMPIFRIKLRAPCLGLTKNCQSSKFIFSLFWPKTKRAWLSAVQRATVTSQEIRSTTNETCTWIISWRKCKS